MLQRRVDVNDAFEDDAMDATGNDVGTIRRRVCMMYGGWKGAEFVPADKRWVKVETPLGPKIHLFT